jgi:hypothetical protein
MTSREREAMRFVLDEATRMVQATKSATLALERVARGEMMSDEDKRAVLDNAPAIYAAGETALAAIARYRVEFGLPAERKPS